MAERKSAAARQRQIIDVAIRLADAVGPDRLSTQMIAEAVGISQPAIFRHFATRDDLWRAIAQQLTARMRDLWAEALAPCDDPVEALRALVGAQLRCVASTPALPAILFSRELHVANGALRGVFTGTMADFQGLLAGHVVKATEQGVFRPDLPASDAALLLMGLVQSAAMRWSLGGRGGDLQAEGVRLLELQLEGFRA